MRKGREQHPMDLVRRRVSRENSCRFLRPRTMWAGQCSKCAPRCVRGIARERSLQAVRKTSGGSSANQATTVQWRSDSMKLEIAPEQFDAIRKQTLEDEMNGLDPGARWARMYPDATEIEFIVSPSLECICPCRSAWADEEARAMVAAKCRCRCHNQRVTFSAGRNRSG